LNDTIITRQMVLTETWIFATSLYGTVQRCALDCVMRDRTQTQTQDTTHHAKNQT
jgi:hypothetical protein